MSKAERNRIAARFDMRCPYCGRWFTRKKHRVTMDHIVPKAKGGITHELNLRPACPSCNSAKADRTVEEFMAMIWTLVIHNKSRWEFGRLIRSRGCGPIPCPFGGNW